MTNEEFSNAFDTLLNAYKHKAEFGDLSSMADVTIDEYEKSIFLTLAQDNIVKNYFTRSLNPTGEGFDDSTRRLMDFSSLITISEITNAESGATSFNDNGVVVSFNDFGTITGGYKKEPLFIINEKVSTGHKATTTFVALSSSELNALKIGDTVYSSTGIIITVSSTNIRDILLGTITVYKKVYNPAKVLLSFVVIPINYKDYDRMMSRAYCEPLKRQAWRLFESDSNSLNRLAELILRTDAGEFMSYKVRYVRRPRPIVLVDLSGTDNNLTIDGIQEITLCELNPIVHQEILIEAVRLALAANGVETADMRALRELAKK